MHTFGHYLRCQRRGAYYVYTPVIACDALFLFCVIDRNSGTHEFFLHATVSGKCYICKTVCRC